MYSHHHGSPSDSSVAAAAGVEDVSVEEAEVAVVVSSFSLVSSAYSGDDARACCCSFFNAGEVKDDGTKAFVTDVQQRTARAVVNFMLGFGFSSLLQCCVDRCEVGAHKRESGESSSSTYFNRWTSPLMSAFISREEVFHEKA